MDQKDYHFYDFDDKNNESKQLLEVQWDATPNEARANPLIALIAGSLVLLMLLVTSVLSWILFHKNRSQVILVHAIISTIALLFAALAVVWALGARSSRVTGHAPSSNLTFLVFIGSIIFLIYHAIAALFMWVHTNFHLNYMQAVKARPDDWNFHFWNYDFDYATLEDWRIFLTIVILALIITLFLGLVAHSAWSYLNNQVETKKIVLGISLISAAAFGFLVVIWHEDYHIVFNILRSKLASAEMKLFFIVFVIAIVAISLAFVNAVGSFLRSKWIHFLFGFLWVAVFFLLVVFGAFLFKDVLQFSHQKQFNLNQVALLAHEDDYTTSCVSKYTPQSAQANASYRWEASARINAWLNPNCQAVANDILIWNYYIYAIFTAFLLGSVAVAAGANFALATSEKDEVSFKSFHIIELITAVVILLLGIAIGLWLIFRPAPEPVARYTAPESLYALDSNGNVITNPSYKHLLESVAGKHFIEALAKLVAPMTKN